MKRMFFLILCGFSVSAFANGVIAVCQNPQALPPSHPNFCPSFKSAAECYCVSWGLPAGMCQDMNVIYARMIGSFGSIPEACKYQARRRNGTSTSIQTCIDDWNCYLFGGRDSTGGLCSSTGNKCG